jgi:hypothetical protein
LAFHLFSGRLPIEETHVWRRRDACGRRLQSITWSSRPRGRSRRR